MNIRSVSALDGTAVVAPLTPQQQAADQSARERREAERVAAAEERRMRGEALDAALADGAGAVSRAEVNALKVVLRDVLTGPALRQALAGRR